MANATTIYHTELNSLKNVKHSSEQVPVAKKGRQRRLHKALLRYHDSAGWPLIREALIAMGKQHLIGTGPQHLVPPEGRAEAWAGKHNRKGADKGRQGLTRFSDNQFAERSGKAAKGKSTEGAKSGNKAGKGKGGDHTTGKVATAKGSKPGSGKARPGARPVFGHTQSHSQGKNQGKSQGQSKKSK